MRLECLSKGLVIEYLSGELTPVEHARSEQHLEVCVQCMGLLGEMTQLPEQKAEIAPGGGFVNAVTNSLPLNTDHGTKAKWLARHYNLRFGEVINEKYRVEKILGEGGMGIVLLASRIALRDQVALKFMHPNVARDKNQAKRFIREARAVVKLSDENVARVLDLGEVEDTGPFIVMEFLDGQDLITYLKAKAPLPIGESVELIRQAASGVAAAHAAGIIHRDLKPGNMFLMERPDGSRRLKVLDFGVSKQVEGDSLAVTHTKMVVGSPMYMAPEMFESARNASFSSDVWSIGVIFYRMLSGRLPFYAESLPELVSRIHFGAPTPLGHWRPEMPKEVVKIVEACLARQPGDRFSTAREFLHALAQLPARMRTDPHSPSVAIAHLSDDGDRGESSRQLPVPVPAASPPVSGARPRHAPWVYALGGALGSALVFTAVLLGSRSTPSADPTPKPRPAEAAGKTVPPSADAAPPPSPMPVATVPDAAVPPSVPDAAVAEPTQPRAKKRPRRPRRERGETPAKARRVEDGLLME